MELNLKLCHGIAFDPKLPPLFATAAAAAAYVAMTTCAAPARSDSDK